MNIARARGTRFRLFPAYAAGYAEPETIEVSLPPGSVGPGPSDPWMYTTNPLEKDTPYDPPDYVPPYRGLVYAPALPGVAGDFDHIPVESEEFLAAHLYGTVRHTLDIWESYLRRRVIWWHADVMPQVELVPIVQWPNAHSGPGFIEMGRQPNRFGRLQPFCLNFDVIAHETGHAILFSQIGVPPTEHISEQFLAFHESFADLIAVMAVMNLRSVRQKLLTQTDGNLYVLNLVNRIGAYSDTEQIRLASNLATMADVVGLRLAPDGTWIDPKGLNRNQHAIAEPLTGAVFDIMVEIYQDGLVSRRLIHPDLDARGWTRNEVERAMAAVHHESARAFARFAQGYFAALDDARHAVGHCMAHVMKTIRSETLTFPLVAARFLEAAAAQGLGPILPPLVDHFLWRGIDPRPHLTLRIDPRQTRRAYRLRGRPAVTEAPNTTPGCQCVHRSGFAFAHRLMTHPHRAQAESAAR
jgi:hypothetical protein